MKAELAREISLKSDGHFTEVLGRSFEKINKACEVGRFKEWVDAPSDEKLFERFQFKMAELGYKIHDRQGNTILVEW